MAVTCDLGCFLDRSLQRACVSYEYAAGGDLAAVLLPCRADKKPLHGRCQHQIVCQVPVPNNHHRTTVSLFAQVLSALVFLHGRGCIHRDVKPGNILLSTPYDRGQEDAPFPDVKVTRMCYVEGFWSLARVLVGGLRGCRVE